MPDAAGNPYFLEGHKVAIFGRNLDLVAGQQSMSAFKNNIDFEDNFSEAGDRFTDDLMGTTRMNEVSQDIRPTPGKRLEKKRRLGFFKGFDNGLWIGTREKAEQLVDPTNGNVIAMSEAREIEIDEAVKRALYDKHYYTDQNGDIATSVFPVSRKIAKNDWKYYKGQADGGSAPTGDAGLTTAKLRNLKVRMSKDKVRQATSGRLCLAVEQEDLEYLATSIEISSRDYNPDQQLIGQARKLADGEIDEMMGIVFVRASSGWAPETDAGVFKLAAWHEKLIKVKRRPLINTRVTERADYSYRWHAFHEDQVGHLRRQDEGIVHIEVARP